jgi:hypothetical protein
LIVVSTWTGGREPDDLLAIDSHPQPPLQTRLPIGTPAGEALFDRQTVEDAVWQNASVRPLPTMGVDGRDSREIALGSEANIHHLVPSSSTYQECRKT